MTTHRHRSSAAIVTGLRRLAAVGLASIGAVSAASVSPAAPPNIVLLLADDMGWGDLCCHGNEAIVTPALDGLFAQGIELERFFVSPICSPTRASLLTGRHHLRLRVLSTTGGLQVMQGDELTLAEALAPAGYVSGCFGKWHNGANQPSTALGQGFAEFLGFTGGYLSNYFDPVLEHDGGTAARKGFVTDVLTDAALAFIDRHASRPFFCYVPFNACHSPLQAPEALFATYVAKGFEPKTAAEYAMVENLDANVGRILAKLDSLKIADNTIVVFTSDNGPNRNLVRTPRFNGGMRGGKGTLFEGGMRAACVIRWPAKLPAGRRVPQIAQHVDMLPTLLDLAGVALPRQAALDGTSLAPLLRGTAETWPERVLFDVSGRSGRDGSPIARFPGTARSQTHRWLHDGRRPMLFDLRDDPGELHDTADRQPAIAAALAQAYDDWFREAVAATEGTVRRFPVRLTDGTDLLAPDGSLDGGGRFFGKGWDNDWAVFPQEAATIGWDLELPRPGRYALSVMHTAARSGLRIRATIGGAAAETVVTAAHDPPKIPRPDRVPRWEVPDKEFALLAVGTLEVPAGVQSLRVSADTGVEIQSVRLRRIDDEASRP
jgi:arylsulfatase A-like enzyme